MKQETKKVIALPTVLPYWRVTHQQRRLYPVWGGASNVTLQYNPNYYTAAGYNATPAVIIDMMAVQTTQCCK